MRIKILAVLCKKWTMEDNSKVYYLFYTICFGLMCLGVYIWFLCGNRTFIWQVDGWTQHYKALVYYAQYIRSIIRGIVFERQISIPSWDFNIGEGADILQTLHYYVIGEPITFFAALIPARYLYLFYNFSVLLRLWLAGIAFSLFCFETEHRNKYAVLAGTITYVFSFVAMAYSVMHPYFLTPMIYLPLLLLGVEKVIKKKGKLFLTSVVFLTAISNFYFFYMLVILTAIYTVIRLFFFYEKSQKEKIKVFVQIIEMSLLGVGLSSVVLLPVIYTFLNNERMGITNFPQYILYPLTYYSQIIGAFLTKDTSFDLYLGFSAPSLLAVVFLLQKKYENKILKIFLGLGFLFMLIPAFGQVLNGFAYTSNRWCFAFSFLVAYILTTMWPCLMEANYKEVLDLYKWIVVYFIVCIMLENSRDAYIFTAIVFCFLFLGILLINVEEKNWNTVQKKNMMSICIMIMSILSISFWYFSSASGAQRVAMEAIETKDANYESLKKNETFILKDDIAQESGVDFQRYSGRGITTNAGMLAGISSTQFYWSLANPNVVKYREALGFTNTQSFHYDGYDDREVLLSLASVLYYLTPSNNIENIPYGYSHIATSDATGDITYEMQERLREELKVKELDERQSRDIEKKSSFWYSLFINKNALPLTYTYDKYIPEMEWNKLSFTQRQEALLSTVVLGENPDIVNEAEPELLSKEISYEMLCNNDEVSIQGNTFVVTAPSAQITLNFNGLPSSEIYFQINGLEFEGVTDYELYLGDDRFDPYHIYNRTNWELLSHEEQQSMKRRRLFWREPDTAAIYLQTSLGTAKTLTYTTPEFTWYQNRHDFLVGFPYTEEQVNSITISFSQKGIYSFDDISIYCQPMETFGERTQKLKTCTMDNLVIENDKVSGTIIAGEPKMLCFSIPYAKGWRAYIDGKAAKLYQANIAYMAVEIAAGEHEIVLCYDTPLLKEGAFISIGSVLVFMIVGLWQWKKQKKK